MNSFLLFYGMGSENSLLLLAGTIDCAFSALIFLTNQYKQKNVLFSLFGLSVSAWAYSMVFFNLIDNQTIFYLSANLLYIFAACAACFFFFFSNSLRNDVIELSALKTKITAISFLIILIIANIPDLVIITENNNITKHLGIGSGYLIYGLYIIVFFSAGLVNLFREYRNSSSFLTKKQTLFLSIGNCIAILIGVNTNLIFPYFNQWDLFWFGPVATVVIVIFVGYSTIKHNLFNTKSIAAESVSFILWVAVTMRLFLSLTALDYVINGILFCIGIGSGLVLIRTVYREIDQLEKIKSIAKDLEVANEHLRVLDRQKSEFVSIASHQLRAPLTAIMGYSSMVIEGTYGAISEKVKEVLSNVLESSRRLSIVIDDFLTISHIEQGKMSYKFETVEMKKILETLVEDFDPRAKVKNLYLHFATDGYDTYNVTADSGKIRQVLSNLIDNSVKYTISGGIDINISKDIALRKTRIQIRDTGIGLSAESIAALFQKFSRAKEVQKIYTDGSGIGLYIGQEMIKAHHGRLWVESDGEGKGSVFFVELMSED